ncbi:MAG: DegT/DnrJ/EryC1/StrS family aminotransferase [Desulfovibrio sp.]|jgi:dTDP-4-amino-4,6-dideoxygalactose transaminase|nr:DegT/DnrJ/EryC1/StrS family aminotransferase [Desulfovibrio sp.]
MKRLPIIRPVFDETETDNLRRCLESGHVTQGPFVAEFEQRFAERHNAAHAVAVTSCTAALHLALLALGIGRGDEVIVPSLTFVATANAVELTGARPVFADVEARTFTVDVALLESAITSKTRAVIPVHLFGLCADMDPLREIAAKHKLRVIEDAACAAGSAYRGRSAGVLGHAACFSFHPRKAITTGEGGMITTNNAELAAKLRILRNHGAQPMPAGAPPWAMPAYRECGCNFRMSDLQAAVGCAQMRKMDAILKERARIAGMYSERLRDMPDVITPFAPDDCGHSWQSYVVRLEGGKPRRDEISERLRLAGVETRCGTHAAHRLEYYARKYGLSPDCCPAAALCEDSSLALPVAHGMKDEDIDRVAACFV